MPDQDYPQIGLEREDRVTIRVEKILPPDPTLRLPFCVDGANACPPEDVGGPPGYIDSSKPSMILPTRSIRTYSIGAGQFDPTAFNISDVNAFLSEIKF